MRPVWSFVMASAFLASAARGEEASVDARRVVREALEERAMGPVAPPVLPVLLPGEPGEPAHHRDTQPRPAPGKAPQEPGRPGVPGPGTKEPHGGPADHAGSHGAMAHSAQSEAVGAAAREAHRIRADAANRAAIGAAASGASAGAARGNSECRDAASTMRTMGMDPEHTGDGHHGGMMPDSGSSGGHH